MKKLILSLLLVNLIIFSPMKPVQAMTETLTLVVKSSSEAALQTTLTIKNSKLAHAIINSKEKSVGQLLPISDMYVTVGDKPLILDRKGNAFDLQSGKKVLLRHSIQKRLFDYARLLRARHYGKMIPWEKVELLIPKEAKFTVIDLETGKRFKVQRRAGDAHADVQPLTRKDTKTMKDIYDGHWSWRRRAILVKTKERTIAASMHGMPHGVGALQNGFPGHFCIHFWKSKTHRSERMDPAHEVMVYQAAGRVHRYLEHANPYELIDAFLVAVNQHDNDLVKMIISREIPEKTEKLLDILNNVEAINNSSDLNKDHPSTAVGVEIPVDVRIYWNGRGETKDSIPFVVTRNAPGERWHIDTDSLLKSLSEDDKES